MSLKMASAKNNMPTYRIPDKMPQIRHGQNATNENRTKCHRIRMHQNCDNKSYNSVTKV